VNRNLLPALDQHVVKAIQSNGHVVVGRTGRKVKQHFIQMSIEMKRVNIEGLSLTGKHDQDDLNGKETLAVVQLLIGDQIVEDLHQVAEEVDVDCMSEPKIINLN